MAHRTGWKELHVGILSSIGVIAVAALILIFGRVGRLHGKTFPLYITISAARGVIKGTDVWLDGQRIGLVRNISFRPPTVPVSERLVMSLNVLDAARPNIRLDSKVQVRSGGTLIGDQVIYLSSGSEQARAVQPGDTIHSADQTDFESLSSDAAEAAHEFPAIIDNVKLLATQLQTAQGTLGALGMAMNSPDMNRVRRKAARLMARLSDSTSVIGLAMGNGLLAQRARNAMAQVDSIRSLLASNDHSLGRFRRDSTLIRDITQLRAQMQQLQALADSPDGTIGRFRTDSAVTRGIHRDLAALDSLLVDLKKHPTRYIAF